MVNKIALSILLCVLTISASAAKPAPKLTAEQKTMQKARAAYEKGELEKAIGLYEQIPQISNYWLEALEEKAYALARLHRFGDALAQLKTIKAPLFAGQVGPEPFFLNALIYLKVCNFKEIFNVFGEFKTRFKDRSSQMQELADKGTNAEVAKVLARLQKGEIKWNPLGKGMEALPRFAARDKEFKRLAEKLSQGGSTVAALKRLQVLARQEANEISSILNKMHLVEVEVVQHLHASPQIAKKSEDFEDVDTTEYMEFPASEKSDDWIDELDHYKVKVKNCSYAEKIS